MIISQINTIRIPEAEEFKISKVNSKYNSRQRWLKVFNFSDLKNKDTMLKLMSKMGMSNNNFIGWCNVSDLRGRRPQRSPKTCGTKVGKCPEWSLRTSVRHPRQMMGCKFLPFPYFISKKIKRHTGLTIFFLFPFFLLQG